MTRDIRLLHVLLLVLAFALGGGPRVHAMAGGPDGMALVICSEDGARTIYLDASGNPASPMGDCAKCLNCLAASGPGLTVTGLVLTVPAARRRRGVGPARALPRRRRHHRPQSRGPPPEAPGSTRTPAPMMRSRVAAGCDLDRMACPVPGTSRDCGRYFKDARR